VECNISLGRGVIVIYCHDLQVVLKKSHFGAGLIPAPYGHQQLIDHRAGHLALPMGFFNSPFRSWDEVKNYRTHLGFSAIGGSAYG
jgi:hypothetical protein